METDKTLSDIARSVLVSSPESDQRTLREKAGLLALLNLLGIVESFYGDGQSAQSSMSLLSSLALGSGAQAPEKPKEPDLISSVMSLAGKLLGGTQGHGGIDPAMVGTLMGALSALSKTRALAPRPAATTPAASTSAAPDSKSPGAPSGDDAEGETLDGTGDSQDREASIEDAVESGEPRAPKETTSPPEVPASPEAAPQSPLQQILGIDPRIITLALNVLADIMKARNAAQTEKAGTGQKRPAPRPESSGPETEVTVTPDGKTVVIPKSRRQPRERLYHKPGLGIYRTRLEDASK